MAEETRHFQHIESVPELKELQRAFADIIRRPLVGDDEMSPDDRVEGFIAGNALLKPHERLELYAQQYWWRVIGSLQEDFPITQKLLGDERFRSVVEEYLSEYPSISYTLRHLGERFSGFLHDNPPLTEPLTEVCYDAARLEYAIIDVFSAGEKKPIALSDLQSDPSELYLSLKPALVLLDLSHEVHRLVEQERLERQQGRGDASNVIVEGHGDEGGNKEVPAAAELSVLRQPTYLVVHRHHLAVYFKEQTEIQFRLLQQLQLGASLEVALETVLREVPETDDFDLGKSFQDWVSLGWLCPTV